MPKRTSADEKLSKFLSSLTTNAEVFALFGAGYPTSVYRVYVRIRPGTKWWTFDTRAQPCDVDPMKAQAKLPTTSRAAALWAPILRLVDYEYHPNKPALKQLFDAASELKSKG